MGDGVDANREPDEYSTFVDIFHDTGIFALYLAFLHIFLAGIAFYAFDIRMDGNLLRRLCLHIQDSYQDVVPYTEPFPGVSQPVKGQIPCQNGSLHAKNFSPDNLFCHRDHSGLNDPVFAYLRLSGCICIQIENLAFLQHGFLPACHNAACLGI